MKQMGLMVLSGGEGRGLDENFKSNCKSSSYVQQYGPIMISDQYLCNNIAIFCNNVI
jgi:hypothetical protein